MTTTYHRNGAEGDYGNGAESTLAGQLRATIAAEGISAGKLARAAGVDRRAVGRFLSGKRSLFLESASRIATALGLRLVEDAQPGDPPEIPGLHERIKRHSAGRPESNPARNAMIRRLRSEGIRPAEIAYRLGVTTCVVRSVLHREQRSSQTPERSQ